MDKEQFAEFADLKERARLAVQRGDWLLRLQIEQSPGGASVIGIVRSDEGRRVVRRVWNVEADRAKLRSPVERLRHPKLLTPSIDEQSRSAEADELDSLMREHRALRLPIPPSVQTITLDGCLRAVLIAIGGVRSEVSMVGACPAEWGPLESWFDGAWRRLEIGFAAEHDTTRMNRRDG